MSISAMTRNSTLFLYFAFMFVFVANAQQKRGEITEKSKVIACTFGNTLAGKVEFKYFAANNTNPVYGYETEKNRAIVKGNSTVAMCREFYDYLKTTGQGMVNWSGEIDDSIFPQNFYADYVRVYKLK